MTHLRLFWRALRQPWNAPQDARHQPKARNQKPNQYEQKDQKQKSNLVESAPRNFWARRGIGSNQPAKNRRFSLIRGFQAIPTSPNSNQTSNMGPLTSRTLGKSTNVSKTIWHNHKHPKNKGNLTEKRFPRTWTLSNQRDLIYYHLETLELVGEDDSTTSYWLQSSNRHLDSPNL